MVCSDEIRRGTTASSAAPELLLDAAVKGDLGGKCAMRDEIL